MSDPNTHEPIDPTSPNHCRPADHPEHLTWPPKIPDDYEDMVAKHVKRGEKSEEAFHLLLACQAFGFQYLYRLKREQKDFRGDWFQLAFLLRCHETQIEKRGVDDDQYCFCPSCQPDWKDTHLENASLAHTNLENVPFNGAHLEKASLIGAHLNNAGFGDAHLENATLIFANLENANLIGANLKNASLAETNLKNANMGYANLESVSLWNANLNNADIRKAILKNANLTETILKNTNLFEANLENARLNNANLTDANLERANLDGAEVRGAKGIVFDSTQVERLLIEGNAPDPWSVLRRNYTGPRFFIHILLLVAFLLPYIGKAIILTGISNGMILIDKTLSAIPTEVSTNTLLNKKPAFWHLMGFTNDNNIVMAGYFFTIAWMMIAYNIFRYILATKVSDLREAEDRSKITPTKKEYLGLYRLHRIANVFMYIGYGALLFQICRWLWFTQIPTY